MVLHCFCDDYTFEEKKSVPAGNSGNIYKIFNDVSVYKKTSLAFCGQMGSENDMLYSP